MAHWTAQADGGARNASFYDIPSNDDECVRRLIQLNSEQSNEDLNTYLTAVEGEGDGPAKLLAPAVLSCVTRAQAQNGSAAISLEDVLSILPADVGHRVPTLRIIECCIEWQLRSGYMRKRPADIVVLRNDAIQNYTQGESTETLRHIFDLSMAPKDGSMPPRLIISFSRSATGTTVLAATTLQQTCDTFLFFDQSVPESERKTIAASLEKVFRYALGPSATVRSEAAQFPKRANTVDLLEGSAFTAFYAGRQIVGREQLHGVSGWDGTAKTPSVFLQLASLRFETESEEKKKGKTKTQGQREPFPTKRSFTHRGCLSKIYLRTAEMESARSTFVLKTRAMFRSEQVRSNFYLWGKGMVHAQHQEEGEYAEADDMGATSLDEASDYEPDGSMSLDEASDDEVDENDVPA